MARVEGRSIKGTRPVAYPSLPVTTPAKNHRGLIRLMSLAAARTGNRVSIERDHISILPFQSTVAEVLHPEQSSHNAELGFKVEIRHETPSQQNGAHRVPLHSKIFIPWSQYIFSYKYAANLEEQPKNGSSGVPQSVYATHEKRTSLPP